MSRQLNYPREPIRRSSRKSKTSSPPYTNGSSSRTKIVKANYSTERAGTWNSGEIKKTEDEQSQRKAEWEDGQVVPLEVHGRQVLDGGGEISLILDPRRRGEGDHDGLLVLCHDLHHRKRDGLLLLVLEVVLSVLRRVYILAFHWLLHNRLMQILLLLTINLCLNSINILRTPRVQESIALMFLFTLQRTGINGLQVLHHHKVLLHLKGMGGIWGMTMAEDMNMTEVGINHELQRCKLDLSR